MAVTNNQSYGGAGGILGTEYKPSQPLAPSAQPQAPTTPKTAPQVNADDLASGGSQAGAGVAGAAIGAGSSIVGGILSGVQAKDQREAAESQAYDDIALAETERAKDLDAQRKQDAFSKQQQQFELLKAKTGLRLELFQRDLMKQQQSFDDHQAAMGRLTSNLDAQQVIGDMYADRLGSNA